MLSLDYKIRQKPASQVQSKHTVLVRRGADCSRETGEGPGEPCTLTSWKLKDLFSWDE